jgi:hypothetical protein
VRCPGVPSYLRDNAPKRAKRQLSCPTFGTGIDHRNLAGWREHLEIGSSEFSGGPNVCNPLDFVSVVSNAVSGARQR